MSEIITSNLSKKCGAFQCGKWFTPRNVIAEEGIMLICPECEERINEGIMINLHNKSGRTKGHWHELEGYKKED